MAESCKSCKHWEENGLQDRSGVFGGHIKNTGICKKTTNELDKGKGMVRVSLLEGGLIGNYPEIAPIILTKPDFLCILYREKE